MTCCQVVVVRPLSSGNRFLAVVVRPLSSRRICQAVVFRPSSSRQHYPLLSGRRRQAVVVRPEEYESNVNHNMNQSVTRNFIGNAKMRSPTYFLSFIPLQIRLNLLKNLSKSQKHVQMLLEGFGAIMF